MSFPDNYISSRPHRFKRWSNKAFAVFNSIGKIVHIGVLSRIVHGISTVKSILLCILKELLVQIMPEDELVDKDLLKGAQEIELKRYLELVLSTNYIKYFPGASNETYFILTYILIKRPFWGLFSCVYIFLSCRHTEQYNHARVCLEFAPATPVSFIRIDRDRIDSIFHLIIK